MLSPIIFSVRGNRMEDAPSKFTVDVDKNQRGKSDVVFGTLFITLVFLYFYFNVSLLLELIRSFTWIIL